MTRPDLRTARVLVALALFGCVEPNGPSGCDTLNDPLAQIPVREASLEGLSLWRAVAVVGPARGEADLVIIDPDGRAHAFSATLIGLDVGAAVSSSAVLTFDQPVPLELPGPGLTARNLLGVYEGATAGFDVGVGVTVRRLSNDFDVVLSLGALSTGLGAAPLALEQLDLQLTDDPAQSDAGG